MAQRPPAFKKVGAVTAATIVAQGRLLMKKQIAAGELALYQHGAWQVAILDGVIYAQRLAKEE
jgi:hypothetical protein